jgi:hypothetical protein
MAFVSKAFCSDVNSIPRGGKAAMSSESMGWPFHVLTEDVVFVVEEPGRGCEDMLDSGSGLGAGER